jgi:hypothetical protein
MTSMTGLESRALKVGARVRWAIDQSDQGTIVGVHWSAVQIKWDTGVTHKIMHNDMASVKAAK